MRGIQDLWWNCLPFCSTDSRCQMVSQEVGRESDNVDQLVGDGCLASMVVL